MLSPVILKFFIHSPEIYKTAVDYLEWRCFGLLFSFPFLAFRAFFVGITKTRILSWAATLAVLINIPCDYLFIFSFNWGISGAAIASLLAGSQFFIDIGYLRLLANEQRELGVKTCLRWETIKVTFSFICMEHDACFH